MKRTFDLLGEALEVSFQRRPFNNGDDTDGWILLEADRAVTAKVDEAARPCYVVIDDADLTSCGHSSRLTFANGAELNPMLRCRDIVAGDIASAKGLPGWLRDVTPLAFKGDSAVWAVQRRRDIVHHYVTLPPPELLDGSPLFTHFSGSQMGRLLALILFVRSIADDGGWDPPPLQASFMCDDPNLHSTSYGFIDYRQLIRHAAAGNYHVSIATIPLDTWFVHRSSSAMFRSQARQVSLLYHGNDHVSNELARSQSTASMHRVLSQAVGRIAGMEARTGLKVARVMAPPHGACNEMALGEMALLGFEAVCVSRGSLRHHNRAVAWSRTIGMNPCDRVAGLPVLPRFGLSVDWRNDVLIAALLRQAIVPMTHHQAMADGYGRLDEVASFINSLGKVAWGDMTTISRSLYARHQNSGTLTVRMLSNRISVAVPEGTTQIQAQRTRPTDRDYEMLFWRSNTGQQGWSPVVPGQDISVQEGATVEIATGSASSTRAATCAQGRRGLTPVARRLLTEGRDRVLPSIHRLSRAVRSGRLAWAR
jgi:hypothetical protein